MILATFGPAQLLFLFVIFAAVITVAVLYFITLQNSLKQVDRSRRLTEPGNVWLMFIPLFNIVYGFILYPNICDSVKAEYKHRGLPADGDFGRSIGITMPILNLAGIIPFIGSLAGLANLILFIIFWSKMAGYKNKLASTPNVSSDGFNISDSDLLDN